MTTERHINPNDPAYLIISREGEDPKTFPLERGASVFVGSGSNCRLILENSEAMPIHCMIRMGEDKELKVQDWNTGQTVLNGAKVDGDIEFASGDILTIAEYRIIPVLTREFHLGIASELLSEESTWGAAGDGSASSIVQNTDPTGTGLHSDNMSDFAQFDSSDTQGDSFGHCDEVIDQIVSRVKQDSVPLNEHGFLSDESAEVESSSSEQVFSEGVSGEMESSPAPARLADGISAELTTDDPVPNVELNSQATSDLPHEVETEYAPTNSGVVSAVTREQPDPQGSFVNDTATPPTIKTGGFQYDVDADLHEEIDPGFAAAGVDPFANDPFASRSNDEISIDFSTDFVDDIDGDEAALLRMEIDQLRFELVDRDAQIASLRESMAAGAKADPVDDGQTMKLVGRLEELLEELKTSDERVRHLEELLRLSDEATAAERDEREQLDSWVSEIESRVQQRDSEFEAEIERLNQRLAQSQEQVKNAEIQFKKLLRSQQTGGDLQNEISEQSKELIEECRHQIRDLREKLETACEENTRLQKEAESMESSESTAATVKELQDKLVALQVESSRERAEMARRHAELERIRDELEERLNNVKTIGKNDSRIKAMREHLREIHEKEKVEEEANRKNTLSGRIASLLSRLR